MKESSKAIPIVVVAFNRKEYLRKVLESLAVQLKDMPDREILFFQDGAVNAYSGQRRAADEDIEACAELFKQTFPHGRMMQSAKNIGICENFDRAESYVFNELGAEVAYFFEDDLVLSPLYIRVMDKLWESVKGNERIGYFAAYGNHTASYESQKKGIERVIPLGHHWGFGLRRSHWVEMRAFLKPYFDIVMGRDYRERDSKAIREWFSSLGYAVSGTSQDGAKSLATNLLGRWRLRTFACWAKYIGEVGTHATSKFYAEHRFGNTTMIDVEPTRFDIPDENSIIAFIEKERGAYRTLWEQLQSPAARPKAGALAGRVAAVEDVRNAYRLLLDREPENEKVVQSRVGMKISRLRESFLSSSEFRSRNPDLVAKLSSKWTEAKDPATPTPRAGNTLHKTVMPLLFRQNPFEGFEVSAASVDRQGWNGTHVALARAVARYRPRVVFDVGVWKGQSTFFLADHMKKEGIDGIVLAIDTWLGSPEHWTQTRTDGVLESLRLRNGYPQLYYTFLSNAKLLGHDDIVIPLPQTSQNAAAILRRLNIRADLIHIDAAHEYEAVLQDCAAFYELLNPGGILIGDDYAWEGVKAAAHKFADERGLRVVVDQPKWSIEKPLH